MIIVDVNLLLYSVVTGFPQHARARAWWEEALNGTTEIGLTGPAVFGFLRLSTNPRVLTSPMSVDNATQHVSEWLDRPHVRFLLPGPRHLDIVFDFLRGIGTARNLTTDAQLAAMAVEYQAELHSNDTDFSRFGGLRWVNPIAG